MEPVLELKNVSFRYSKDSRRVLNDLSYSFEEGKLYAIVGRSGAGKTTLLSLLSGLAVPEKGEVLMRGENIAIWTVIIIAVTISVSFSRVLIFCRNIRPWKMSCCPWI